MKHFVVVFAFLLSMTASALADRPVLLVTPAGVYQSTVVNGVPGPWVAQEIDVVIQGFGGGGGTQPVPPDAPDPPVSDPVVAQIVTISKATLKDKKEAVAVASIIDTLSKFGLTGQKFKEALQLATPIADTSMKAGGRINRWVEESLAVTTDPAKLKAGVKAAWDIETATLEAIHAAALEDPSAALPDAALDWAQIIQIIQMIIELLKNLGIIS